MSSTHVAHPKCPSCGRALYKAMEQGAKVKPADPYQFCRNNACELWGYREAPAEEPAPEETPAGEETEAIEPATVEPAPMPRPPAPPPGVVRRRRGSRPASEPTPEAPAVEPDVAEAPTISKAIEGVDGGGDSIDKCRQQIRWIIRHVSAEHSQSAIGLALAILNQELGHHDAANIIIDELGLHEYGLDKTGVEEEAAAEADPSTNEAEA